MKTEPSDLTYYDFLNNASESGKFIYSIIESLPQGILIIDQNDRILYANHKMAVMTGYPRRELVGKLATFFLNIPNEDDKLKNISSKRVIGIYETYELFVRRKKGNPFLGHTITCPFKNTEGKIIGTINVITDITFEKRESEFQALAIAATKALNSVIIINKSGRIEWVNEGFTALTGYELHEVIDTKGDIFMPTGFDSYLKIFGQVIREKKPTTYENKYLDKNNEEHWVVSTLTPTLEPSGDIKNIVLIDTDINRSRKAEEQLQLATRLTKDSLVKYSESEDSLSKAHAEITEMIASKERLLASISHEIRTPLNGILGLVDYLLGTELNIEQHRFLYAIKLSGDTLRGVINDILDISKIDAGKMVLDESLFRLDEIIETSADIYSIQAIEKNIELVKEIHFPLPEYLLGDQLRLRQVIYNLLSNAVKFTTKGQIIFSASVKEEKENDVLIEISVRDTGCGIPEDKMDYLFKDFTQLNADTSQKYGGTGLGLAITKRLVELQGGVISVRSKVNEGSTFSVAIRFKKCNDQNKIKKYLKDKETSVSLQPLNAKVLIAEDNVVNQLLSKKLLTAWKCAVDIVDSGDKVLQKLQENKYDLLLLDLEMPGMDGYKVANEIRKNMTSLISEIPIIAVTAHAETSEAEKCIRSGMDDYILKPFNPSELNKKMVRLLKNKQFTRTARNNKYVDYEIIRKTSCGDDKFMLQLINKFIISFSTDLSNLVALYTSGKMDRVSSLTHKMKSSATLFGLKNISSLLAEIEKNASRNILQAELLSEIEKVGQEIISELNLKRDEISRA